LQDLRGDESNYSKNPLSVIAYAVEIFRENIINLDEEGYWRFNILLEIKIVIIVDFMYRGYFSLVASELT
jgi:hypothetical protein